MKCKWCGKEFESDSGHRVFCSKECYRLFYNDYRKQEYHRIKATDPETIHKRDIRTRELVKERTQALRKADMQVHAREIVGLSHKGNAEELITEYLLANFIFRKKK